MGHSSESLVPTLRFARRKLPHWEVAQGRYFVTVRCAGTLPGAVLRRIEEIAQNMKGIEPRSPAFAALQREGFRTLEEHLDGCTDGWLVGDTAGALAQEFANLNEVGFAMPHFAIMPNHWHGLLVAGSASPTSLTSVMKRIKGRSAKAIRRSIGGAGPVWQREWFDHWIRDDSEWQRCVDYIRANPVKAGLVSRWEDHPWTK